MNILGVIFNSLNVLVVITSFIFIIIDSFIKERWSKQIKRVVIIVGIIVVISNISYRLFHEYHNSEENNISEVEGNEGAANEKEVSDIPSETLNSTVASEMGLILSDFDPVSMVDIEDNSYRDIFYLAGVFSFDRRQNEITKINMDGEINLFAICQDYDCNKYYFDDTYFLEVGYEDEEIILKITSVDDYDTVFFEESYSCDYDISDIEISRLNNNTFLLAFNGKSHIGCYAMIINMDDYEIIDRYFETYYFEDIGLSNDEIKVFVNWSNNGKWGMKELILDTNLDLVDETEVPIKSVESAGKNVRYIEDNVGQCNMEIEDSVNYLSVVYYDTNFAIKWKSKTKLEYKDYEVDSRDFFYDQMLMGNELLVYNCYATYKNNKSEGSNSGSTVGLHFIQLRKYDLNGDIKGEIRIICDEIDATVNGVFVDDYDNVYLSILEKKPTFIEGDRFYKVRAIKLENNIFDIESSIAITGTEFRVERVE